MRIVWNDELYHMDRKAYARWYYQNFKKLGRLKGRKKNRMAESIKDAQRKNDVASIERGRTGDILPLSKKEFNKRKTGPQVSTVRNGKTTGKWKMGGPSAKVTTYRKRGGKTTRESRQVNVMYKLQDPKKMSKAQKIMYKNRDTNKHIDDTVRAEAKKKAEEQKWHNDFQYAVRKHKEEQRKKSLPYKAKKAYKSVSKKAVKRGRRMLKRFKSII